MLDILSSIWPPEVTVRLSKPNSGDHDDRHRTVADQFAQCPQCNIDLDLKLDEKAASVSEMFLQRKELHEEQSKASRKTLPESNNEWFQFMRYVFKLLFNKKEREVASSTPMLRSSIGDQITSIFQGYANQRGESPQKTNIRLFLAIFDEFKEAQRGIGETKQLRKGVVEKLHHVDIDPRLLALLWLRVYTRDWSEFYQGRLRVIAEEDRATRNP